MLFRWEDQTARRINFKMKWLVSGIYKTRVNGCVCVVVCVRVCVRACTCVLCVEAPIEKVTREEMVIAIKSMKPIKRSWTN